MNDKRSSMEWERERVLVNNEPHDRFNTSQENWCYTVEPIVKAKRAEPLAYHFAGWAKSYKSTRRYRIEGTAVTIGECTAMCQSHAEHVMNDI